MRCSFLGRVAVDGPAADEVLVSGLQPALVLARLVLERPHALVRNELIELLWPEHLRDDRDGPARKVVSRARSALTAAGLPPSALDSSGGVTTIRLPDDVEVDIEVALDDVSVAEKLLGEARWEDAATSAQRAAHQLRRPFLLGSTSPWTLAWRERLEAATERALLANASAALGAGRLGDAIRFGDELLAWNTCSEPATRLLMTAHDRAGNRLAALGAYQQLRRNLDEDLGVRPSVETEELHRELLGDAPASTTTITRSPEPVPAAASGPFVGRHLEAGAIADELQHAGAGAARIVVVEGEPGIGKTRLVAEATDAARDAGASILWGRCEPVSGVAHGPFADIVAQIVRDRPDAVARLGVVATHLAPLVPESARPTDEAPPTSTDQAAARLFRAVGAAIASTADRPLVLVLDDLHWADGDTLALLRHVIPWLEDRPCVVLLTLRTASPMVAETLAELQRLAPTRTITLTGLDVGTVAEILRASSITLTGDVRAIAQTVTERTAGNPLYVTQLVQEAEDTDASFDPNAVPAAVGRLFERRLAALEPELASTLVLAAVAGPEFDLTTVEACSPMPRDRVLDIVEELCRQRFLEERGAARFAFAHELVHDAVLATVGTTRKERLHLQVATALARSAADPGLVAMHFVRAGRESVDDAVTWSLAAGRAALRQSAWRVGREHFETAARLATDPSQRGEALIGTALAGRALGDLGDAHASLDDALRLAQDHHLGRLVAAATLGLVGGGGRGVALELNDAERERLLRAALPGLSDDDTDLLVPVLAELAVALVLTEADDERRDLCARCLDVARRSGEDSQLARALLAQRVARMGPAGSRQRVADGRELLALPRSAVAPEVVVAAQLGLVEDLLELGDRAGADQSLASATDAAAQLQHPYWSWATACWSTLVAIIDGRVDDAEVLALAALEHQLPTDHPEAIAAFGVNLVDVRLFQGRAGEVVDLLRGAADDSPNIPAYRAVLALCCAESGDLDAARAALDTFTARDFVLPADSNWLLAVAVLADACATLCDRDAAGPLTALLEPWADRQVILNCYGGGGAYWGPVAHHLGRLATLLGDHAGAHELLRKAVELSEQFGAPRFAARSREALRSI